MVIQEIQRISTVIDVILCQFESTALCIPWNKEFVLAVAESHMEAFLVLVWCCWDVISVTGTPWDLECDNMCPICAIEHSAW